MIETEPHCGNCKHFRFVWQGNAQKVGECRRNAPQARTDGGPDIPASWPRVLELDSCGEFAAKGAATPVTVKDAVAAGVASAIMKQAEQQSRAGQEHRQPRSTTKGGARRAKR